MTSKYRKIALDQLSIDPRVQRTEGVEARRATAIAANFDPDALGTITVSERADGTLIVLDGMTRTAGARQHGYQGTIPAMVFTGLTIEEEGHLFLALNATKTPSALSKFLVRVVIGEPEATEMNSIIGSHGWEMGPTSPGMVSAATAVERVYRNGGGTLPDGCHPDVLDQVMEIITAAWEHDEKATQGAMLLAVAQLVGRFGPSIDTKKMVSEMQATRPGVLIGKARVLCDVQGGSVPGALAKILAGMHNRKRRTNLLPDWVWIR